jgi:dihydrofolate synthase/folylpolyglutamate synthase
VSGILELLEPVVDAIVCTRSSSPRAMPPEWLGQLAIEIFGHERVTVAPDLPDAIEIAVALAEEDVDTFEGVAVLITGSVVTVADARSLLVRS